MFDPVEFASFNQGRNHGPVLGPCVVSCEESVFPIQSDGSDGALDGIDVNLDASISRAIRKQYSAEENIRIVPDSLKGEDSIAELCRREGIARSLYYSCSKQVRRPRRSA